MCKKYANELSFEAIILVYEIPKFCEIFVEVA